MNLLSELDIKGLTDMGIQLSKEENTRMEIINKAEFELQKGIDTGYSR